METVIPYYKAWMERFPDLDALAGAGEEEVLRAWQGLGYYSRARNLQGAAQIVRERLGGELPRSAAALRALPGIGEYTSGAVASIAFGEVVPAVDGNVRRVLSRLLDLKDPGVGMLRRPAEALVDPNRPGDFNQALMEHGALVCTPRAPDCGGCPLSRLCLARAGGTVDVRPGSRKGRPIPLREESVAVVVAEPGDGPRFLLRKRPPTGLLAGMWEFPGSAIDSSGTHRADEHYRVEASVEELTRELGLPKGDKMRALDPVTHLFTHLRAVYRPFLIRLPRPVPVPEPNRWVLTAELETVPLPRAQLRILSQAMDALELSGD